VKLFVDEDLLTFDEIWAAAGTRTQYSEFPAA